MIRILTLLLLLALPLRAEEFPATYAVTGVAANDVLNIRARPDAVSAIIGALAPDATGVEVLGTSGRWAVVNTDEGTGYAALRFLSREPGASWGALRTPLTCVGTEPFWALEIDPGARLTTFQSPEMPEPMTNSMTEIWPAGPWGTTAALTLQQGLGVLQPRQCSDGMSDRSYGIAIDIFSRIEDHPRLTGCCSLGLR